MISIQRLWKKKYSVSILMLVILLASLTAEDVWAETIDEDKYQITIPDGQKWSYSSEVKELTFNHNSKGFYGLVEIDTGGPGILSFDWDTKTGSTSLLYGNNKLYVSTSAFNSSSLNSAVSLGGTGTKSGSYEFQLSDETGYKVYLAYNYGGSSIYNSTALISNIIFREAGDRNINIRGENGTISGIATLPDGTTNLLSTGEYDFPLNSEITLAAAPDQDNIFYGWYVDGVLISEDPQLTFDVLDSMTLQAVMDAPGAYAAWNGDKLFVSLEDAVNSAVAGLDKNVILAADYTLTENLQIPKGVTLFIPCRINDEVYDIESEYSPEGSGKTAKPVLYRQLTIPLGVTLELEGNVIVNAVAGIEVAGSGAVYNVSAGYGQINLNGQIIINGGTLECNGYINGDGTITANSGAIGDVYTIPNWRGGTYAKSIYSGKTNRVFPMNQGTCRNISTDVVLHADASLYGLVRIYTNPTEILGVVISEGGFSHTRYTLIEPNSLLRLNPGSYLVKSVKNGRGNLEIHGGAEFGEGYFKLEASILALSLKSSDYVLPLDGVIDVELYDGIYKFSEDIKFMSGAKVTVGEGAVVQADSDIFVLYDAGFIDPYLYKGSSGAAGSTAQRYPTNRGAAQLILEGGRVEIEGSVGGEIVAKSLDSSISFENTDNLYVETKEAGETVKSGTSASIVWETFTTNTVLLNSDGSETEFSPEVGKTYYVIEENGAFKWTDHKHEWAEAACEEPKRCTVEGCDAADGEPLGHDFSAEWTIGQEAACLEEGLRSHHCMREGCNERQGQEVIEKKGHNYGNPNMTVEPTCELAGSVRSICLNDGCEEYEDTQISALGHDFSAEWTIDQEPTCIQYGLRSHHCTREECDEHQDQETIEMVEHTHGAPVVFTEPTCLLKGVARSYCMTDGCDAYKDMPLDPLGHLYSEEWTIDQEATCQEDGYSSRHCTRFECDHTTDDKILSKTDHDFGEWEMVNEATCKDAGYRQRHCRDCDESDGEVIPINDNHVVAPDLKCTDDQTCLICEKIVVAASSHEWDDGEVDSEATCQAEGIYRYRCLRCGDEAVEAIDKLSHTPGDPHITAAADCENDGEEIISCTECDEVISTNILLALGHEYQDTEVVKPATCIAAGIMGQSCIRCDADQTRELSIDPDAHQWDGGTVTKAATSSLDGVKTYVCLLDGEHTKTEAIPATGGSGGSSGGSGSSKGNSGNNTTAKNDEEDNKTVNPGEETPVKDSNSPSNSSGNAVNSSSSGDFIAAAAEAFGDVDANDWYAGAVGHVTGNGVFNGTGNGTFEPNTEMTRAMFMTVLANTAVGMNLEINGESASFGDVSEDSWYYQAVLWASANGIANGYSETEFGPDDNITREQMTLILVNFADYVGVELKTDGVPDFKDASSISSWALESVKKAAASGLISGYDDGSFKPQETATRAETAAVLSRMLDNFLNDVN